MERDRHARRRRRRLHAARRRPPDGPLTLLDFVGLDVASAIGDRLHADSGPRIATGPPELIHELVGEGKLGRKSGEGFYDYVTARRRR